jgi:outer membrane protein assembly factor BamD (BamD/ComL family)
MLNKPKVMTPQRMNRQFRIVTILSVTVALFTLQGCSSGPNYTDTLKSIEQVEVILKQAERDGLPETMKLSASTLDSLYSVYVWQWPDSSKASLFMYNRANMKAEYNQDYEGCIVLLDSLVLKYPDSEFSERSRFLKGYTLANHVGDTTRARLAYEDFLSKHPGSELVPSVEFEIRTLGKSMDQLDSLFNIQN